MELLLHTVSFLDKADSRTLYSLCLTSKLLCSLCQPMLFSTFTSVDKQAGLLPFTTAITRNPQLASHVQDITISFPRDLSHVPAPKQPISDLLPAFRHVIAKIDPPEELEKQWLDAIQGLYVSAFIPLILIQTSNLHRLSFTTLDVDAYDVKIWREVGDLQREREATYLPAQLKELEIKYNTTYCFPSFGEVEDLYLPFIKSLDVCHLGPFYCGDPPTIEPGTLNISDLALQVSQPGEITVDFINGCTALRSFKYRVVEDDGGYFLPGHLQAPLRAHAHTLEELKAYFGTTAPGSDDDDYEEEEELGEDEEFYASFAEFVCLKRLTAEGYLMHRLERADFPPALEEYTVRSEGNFSRDILKLLSSSRDAGFPPLKMNIVSHQRWSTINERWEEDPDRECAALVEMLRGTRISVKLVVTSPYNGPPDHLVFADGVGYRRKGHGDISEDDWGGLLCR